MSVAIRSRWSTLGRGSLLLLIVCLSAAALVPTAAARALGAGSVEHLVVSEIATGGASSSDELIELYNPTAAALPLEGLELIYVSATGATITRRAAWTAGAALVPPGGHVLVANEAGVFASIADLVYAGGMAATGGSVALRAQGAGSAIDAVGWGTAESTWREGANAAAPDPGNSVERLPGGTLGSTRDTDDNASDFVERLVPDPQNLSSPPTPDPAGSTPSPTIAATPAPTAAPTASASTPTGTPPPTATPGAEPISIAAARAAPAGASVTIEATALTASDFHDGGGYLADSTGGIAVLLADGAYARGELLRVTGVVDDRFSQRTVRSTAADVVLVGSGDEPRAEPVRTGSVDETVEGVLVRLSGVITGSQTTLTTGTALDLDDGSGPARVIVPIAAGIELGGWTRGASVDLIGVVGQRDSTGSGAAGYRVMPRAASDVLAITPSASPAPSGSPSMPPNATPTPSPSDAPPDVISIDAARAAAKNARVRVRGVVTLAPGTVDETTAVIQDATGAIVLRLSDEARVGHVTLGQRIDVSGVRSTKGGMETLRVSEPPASLGTAVDPVPVAVGTGSAGEPHEALLVVARGTLVESARRASSGTVSFEIDDGSGPLRVSIDASLHADDEPLVAGTWVEVRGVLGQETTGAQPLRGYRIWPRTLGDMSIVAAVTPPDGSSRDADGAGRRSAEVAAGSLERIGEDLEGVRVGATLVSGPWVELGVGGLLWDGARLVAIDARSSSQVVGLIDQHRLPLSLELTGLRATGVEPVTGASLVALDAEPGNVVVGSRPPMPPRSRLASANGAPAWVSVVGRLDASGDVLVVDGTRVPIDERCESADPPSAGAVRVTGVATADPLRLIVPCDGMVAAPVVARTPGPAQAAGRGHTASAAVHADSGDDTGRVLVAALFLLGAVMLAGGAALRRVLSGDEIDRPEADLDRSETDQAAAELPRLTLVRVPNEHGP